MEKIIFGILAWTFINCGMILILINYLGPPLLLPTFWNDNPRFSDSDAETRADKSKYEEKGVEDEAEAPEIDEPEEETKEEKENREKKKGGGELLVMCSEFCVLSGGEGLAGVGERDWLE